MSAFTTLGQVFTEPSKAFESLHERANPVLPLLLLIFGSVAVLVWYYQIVDMPWLVEQLLAANPQSANDPAAAAAMEKFMTPATMTVTSVVGVVIMIPLVLLLTAVYYLLAAKVVGSEIGFGKWFCFATWASVPTLINIPAGAVAILLADNGQLLTNALNPLTLNQLLFNLPLGSPWTSLLEAIHLPMLWSLLVSAIGYQVWTKKPAGTAWTVVLLPYIVIFGIWAAVAATRGGA